MIQRQSPRTTLPILTGIKIDAKDNNVILTGSDSEISIEITIPKQVDREDIVDITEMDQWFFLVVSLLTSLKNYQAKMLNYQQMNSFKPLSHQDIQNLI